MRARVAVAVVLAFGCREDVVVSTRVPPSDGGDVVVADAASDAAADAAPDVTPPRTASERLGMHTRGVAVIADGVDDARSIRFVYTGDDGRLHVERRLSATLARACEVTVAPPDGATLVSAPASIDEEAAVVVAARDRGGAIRYHALRALRDAGPCGAALSAWEPLPEAPAGVSFRSAPAALWALLEGQRVWTVVALASDGRVWSVARLSTSPGAWSQWMQWPATPPGEEVVSAPASDHEGAAGVLVSVLTQDARGRRRQRRMSFYVVTRVWAPAWREEEMPAVDVDAALAQRVFEVEARYRQGPSPYGLWRAVRDVNGAVWTQSLLQRHGFADAWTAWRSFGDPFAGLGVKSTAPLIAPRRDARQIAGEMLFLSVALHGPAAVRYTSAWFDEPVDPPGRWREAPDPLR